MPTVILVVGVLIALIGSVWLLQGLSFLGGSPMTGDPFWAVMGAALIVIGVLAAVAARRLKS